MDSTQKLKAICEGFKNYAFKTEEHADRTLERAKICSECPKAKKSSFRAMFLPDTEIKQVEGMLCGICNCVLSAKVRQDVEGCPEKKW